MQLSSVWKGSHVRRGGLHMKTVESVAETIQPMAMALTVQQAQCAFFWGKMAMYRLDMLSLMKPMERKYMTSSRSCN